MVGKHRGIVDDVAARELALYAVNNGDLYRQRIEPILKNLMRKRGKGVYDRTLALKLWKYAADDAARRYIKEFGGSFNVSTRLEAAAEIQQYYQDEVEGFPQTPVAFRKRMLKNPRRKRNARKAVNATAYVICVRVGKQTGYFTGTGFDTAKGRARMYRTERDALKLGQRIADKYRTPVHVKKITVTFVRKRNPSRAGAPQIISGRETFKDTARAAKLFKDFTGEKPGHRERIKIPNLPKVAMAVGSLDGIDYTTVRDGVTERYHHPFKRDARPALAVSPSGKQLLIVGGRYTFTDRGIEDG